MRKAIESRYLRRLSAIPVRMPRATARPIRSLAIRAVVRMSDSTTEPSGPPVLTMDQLEIDYAREVDDYKRYRSRVVWE